ncbi:MAG: glycosyltransferase, partial [Candidatus Njordarchaeota archaeon]
MHICLTTDFFWPEIGGVQTHVYDLARTAIKAGHRVTVITTVLSERKIEIREGIRVIRVAYPRYAGILEPSGLKDRLKKIFSKIKPDIVHAHHAFSPMGISTGWASKELGLPVVLTNHSIPIGYEAFKDVWNVISRIISLYPVLDNITKYDAIIAVSKLAAEFIRLFYKGYIKIVPPPIGDDFFDVEATKEDIGFSNDDKIVLFVGRLDPKKGLEFALHAFRYVTLSEPKAKLCIVGPGSKTYRGIIQGLAERWGIGDNVIFIGKVSREMLKKFYVASDVFIFPSIGGESFGIVVLESMAAGTPVVAAVGG